jgi:hypothetical protein
MLSQNAVTLPSCSRGTVKLSMALSPRKGLCVPLAIVTARWCQRTFAMSALRPLQPGGLRRSTHHFILKRKDGARRWISEFIEGLRIGGEDGVVGPLAAWGVAQTIGRAFSKPSSSSYFQMVPHGGNRLTPRRRSRLALTLCPSDPDLGRGPLSLSTPCR